MEVQAPRDHVRLLSVGFFCVFSAYMTAELMQTTVNGSSGYLCIFVVYSCLAVMSLFAPWLVYTMGTRVLLCASSVAYVFITASYLLPGNRLFLALSCAWVGLSGAVLWNAQSCYLAECTLILAHRSGQQYTDSASSLNASFYRIFSGAGCASNALGALVISYSEGSVTHLFAILSSVGIVGSLCLLVLPDASSLLMFEAPAWRRKDAVTLPGACESQRSESQGREDETGQAALRSADALQLSEARAEAEDSSVPHLGVTVEMARVRDVSSASASGDGSEAARLHGGEQTMRTNSGGEILKSGEDMHEKQEENVQGDGEAGRWGGRESKPPTPLFVIRFICSEHKMQLLAPMLVATGMKMAAMVGILMQNVGVAYG